MKYHVFIATTKGVIAIQDLIALDDPDIQSLITVNGTATLANISHHYHHFVKKGSGIIQLDFGSCSYRANIEQGIDQGNSWQLAMYIAHVLSEKSLLGNGIVTANDQVIVATGEINTSHRTILAVTKVAEKYKKLIEERARFSSKALSETPEKHPVFFIPKANEVDINAALSKAINVESFTKLDDVITRIERLITASVSLIEQGENLDSQSIHKSAHQETASNETDSPEIDELNELEALLKSEEHQSYAIDNEHHKTIENNKDNVLKKHRNSLDETKEVENMLASFMYKFNPKHIVSRIVGFCGFALFVIAVILTVIKDKPVDVNEAPNAEQPSKVKEVEQLSVEKTTQEKPAVTAAYLVAHYTENNDCQQTTDIKTIVNKPNHDNFFKAFNRHQLCELTLLTHQQVSDVFWFDNNKQHNQALTKSVQLNHQPPNEISWNIPLVKQQLNDTSYFLVVVEQLKNKEQASYKNAISSDLNTELNVFIKHDSRGLKVTQKEVSDFLKNYFSDKPANFFLYQHTLEVF